MNNIIKKYMDIGEKLHAQGKTGLECEYCGRTEIETNHYGSFCKGCSHPKKSPYGWIYGVPVYDMDDYYKFEFCI